MINADLPLSAESPPYFSVRVERGQSKVATSYGILRGELDFALYSC
jgi:hypothetical protein